MTNQGQLQAWLRAQTSKAFDFNGDMLAFLKSKGYDTTLGYNGALMDYLKDELSLSGAYTLNDLQQRFATSKGKEGWYAVTELNA